MKSLFQKLIMTHRHKTTNSLIINRIDDKNEIKIIIK